MAVWKISKLGRVSSVTGEVFPPDCPVVTALFGEEEEVGEDKVRGAGFVRRDFREEEATPERLAGAFCVWRTRTEPAQPAEKRALDLGMAREFLQRLLDQGDEERAPVCLALALILIHPFLTPGRFGSVMVGLLGSVTIFFALYAVAIKPRHFTIVMILGVATITTTWGATLAQTKPWFLFSDLTDAAFYLYISIYLLRYVMQAGPVKASVREISRRSSKRSAMRSVQR